MGIIRVLPPEQACRIAAGEVIDRPAALIRELMDNAIDADSSVIEVSIEGGGSRKAEVSDNGRGMARDDLELCPLAHATSKIRRLEDLATAYTLGFRGEALAAASAVAKLQIVTCTADGEAWKLEVGPGPENPATLERAARTEGSTVRALNLFDTIPARKNFLKREGSEGALCRQVFIEKALAFPELSFRLTQDGRPRDLLARVPSKRERFAAALLETRQRDFLYEIHVEGEGFSADLVIGGPELYRQDRRQMYVFANGRRIQDFSLLQAMEYGSASLFPNGSHPVGAVYLEIDPALADFNIHPAKREVRFRDSGAIHRCISEGLRGFCRSMVLKSRVPEYRAEYRTEYREEVLGGLAEQALFDRPEPSEPATVDFSYARQPAFADRQHFAGDRFPERPPATQVLAEKAVGYGPDSRGFGPQGYGSGQPAGEPIFVGRAFGLFLLVEWGERLFVIDQHAAHERILYDRFLAEGIPGQDLLVPLFFMTESSEDDLFLRSKLDELARLSIVLEREGEGWRIDRLPAGWKLSDSATVRELLGLKRAAANIAESWVARCCCHDAVKDGDYLDNEAAARLAKEALALPDPHCPHGRPIWTELTKEGLLRAVRRE